MHANRERRSNTHCALCAQVFLTPISTHTTHICIQSAICTTCFDSIAYRERALLLLFGAWKMMHTNSEALALMQITLFIARNARNGCNGYTHSLIHSACCGKGVGGRRGLYFFRLLMFARAHQFRCVHKLPSTPHVQKQFWWQLAKS